MYSARIPIGLRRRVAAAGIAVLCAAAPVAAQVDFQRMYILGDSYSAGFMHDTLMEDFQPCAYGSWIARQAGLRIWTDFAMPRITRPGIPGLILLVQTFPFLQFVRIRGNPVNLTQDDPRIYNNLAVPGAKTNDLFLNETTGDNVYFPWILRGRGSALDQVEEAEPDLVVLWIGINETSPALALGFTWPGFNITPVRNFERQFHNAMERLRAAVHGPIVVIDIPDTTLTPFCHALPPYVPDPETGRPILDETGRPVPLLGQDGNPMDPETCVFRKALPWILDGYGVPKEYGGRGVGLPNTTVFSIHEIELVRKYIRSYNDIIADTVRVTPDAYLFRVSEKFRRWAREGADVGGVHIGFSFPFGGFWALDRFHPSPIGHALIANELIEFMNDHLGFHLPLVDMAPILAGTECPLPSLAEFQNSFFQISFNVGAMWMPR